VSLRLLKAFLNWLLGCCCSGESLLHLRVGRGLDAGGRGEG